MRCTVYGEGCGENNKGEMREEEQSASTEK